MALKWIRSHMISGGKGQGVTELNVMVRDKGKWYVGGLVKIVGLRAGINDFGGGSRGRSGQ